MTRCFFLILILLCTPSGCGSDRLHTTSERSASATFRYGVDFFGVQNGTMSPDWTRIFDGVDYVRLGILWRSFGTNDLALAAFISDPRPKHITSRASNGTCDKKKNCGPLEAVTFDQIVQRSVESAQFIKTYCKQCTATIVIQLEDQFSPKKACRIAKAVRASFGILGIDYEIGRNPLNASYLGDSAKCFDRIELHNSDAGNLAGFDSCTWSNDGADLVVGRTVWSLPFRIEISDFERTADRVVRHCTSHLWTADGNCLGGDSSTAQFPSDRICPLDAFTITDINRFLLRKQKEHYEYLETVGSL